MRPPRPAPERSGASRPGRAQILHEFAPLVSRERPLQVFATLRGHVLLAQLAKRLHQEEAAQAPRRLHVPRGRPRSWIVVGPIFTVRSDHRSGRALSPAPVRTSRGCSPRRPPQLEPGTVSSASARATSSAEGEEETENRVLFSGSRIPRGRGGGSFLSGRAGAGQDRPLHGCRGPGSLRNEHRDSSRPWMRAIVRESMLYVVFLVPVM